MRTRTIRDNSLGLGGRIAEVGYGGEIIVTKDDDKSKKAEKSQDKEGESKDRKDS